MLARRSSIRSRSTSQYLSAESRSLSGGSPPAASLLRPWLFATLSSLRLDFALRHLPRPRCPAPVTIVPSFVLSALSSNRNLGAAVTNLPPPRFQQQPDAEVSQLKTLRPICGAALSALGYPAQLPYVRASRLRLRSDTLVRRTLTSDVLRVKGAESGPNRRADPHDAFFHVWPEKRNPQIPSEKQLWSAHCRRTSRVFH